MVDKNNITDEHDLYFENSKISLREESCKFVIENDLKYNEFIQGISNIDINNASDEKFPKYTINENVSIKDYYINTLRISLYRLRLLGQRLNYNFKEVDYKNDDHILYTITALYFYGIINKINNNLDKNEDLARYLISLLLNTSRSYLESENMFRKSVKSTNNLLDENINAEIVLNPLNITEDLKKKVIENILPSKRFAAYLNKFLKHYNLEINENEVVELMNSLKNLVQKNIVFLNSIQHYGMIGANSTLYINYDMIQLYEKRKDKLELFFISTLLHELGHAIIRVILNDNFGLTPRTIEHIEAGYKFEQIIFGTAIFRFEEKLDDKIWNTEGEGFIFGDEQINVLKKYTANQNLFTSGYCFYVKQFAPFK